MTNDTFNINDNFGNPETFADYSFYDCRPSSNTTSTEIGFPTQDQTTIAMSSTPCFTPSPTLTFNTNTNYLCNPNYNNNTYFPTETAMMAAAETPAMTVDGVYQFMVDLEKYDSQTFNNLLSAINSIRSPTDFVVSQNAPVTSSQVASFTENENENVNAVSNGSELVQSPTTTTGHCCSGNGSRKCGAHARAGFMSKKVSNPSAVSRSKIAKKFYAEHDEEEYYYCVDCGEKRRSNTFATEGHHHDGKKLRVRWMCPMCDKSTAVTYRTAHLTTRHGIEKLGKEIK